MPARARASKAYSGGSTRKYSRKVFYPKYATGSTTRSRAFAASERKPPRNVRVRAHLEADNNAIEDWIGK